MFSFFGLKGFSPRCAALVLRCVCSNPGQHAGPRYKHDGWSCPRWSARLRRPCGWGHRWGLCGLTRSLMGCQKPLSLAGLCLLAAVQQMKVLWTSLWFTPCEVFCLVHHWAYFVSARFADINNDTMRSVLNSSANLSSKEFVFPQ